MRRSVAGGRSRLAAIMTGGTGTSVLLAIAALVVLALAQHATPCNHRARLLVTDRAAYDAAVSSTRLALVYVRANGSQPCEILEPALHQLEHDVGDSVTFIGIDYDRSKDLVNSLRVHDVPTLLRVESGKETSRITGAKSASDLRSWLATP